MRLLLPKHTRIPQNFRLRRAQMHLMTTQPQSTPFPRGVVLSKIEGYSICLFCSQNSICRLRTVTPSNSAMGLFCRHCKCTCGAMNKYHSTFDPREGGLGSYVLVKLKWKIMAKAGDC